MLNLVAALGLAYAFRQGKAVIVGPLTNALAPVLTVITSLVIYRLVPHCVNMQE